MLSFKKEKRISLPYIENPDKTFENFLELPFPIFLDSCSMERKLYKKDMFSAQPTLVFTSSADSYQILDSHGLVLDSGPNAIEKLIELETEHSGNLMGYVGYHACDHEFKIHSGKKRLLPDICIGIYPWRIEIQHDIRKSELIYLEDALNNESEISSIIERFKASSSIDVCAKPTLGKNVSNLTKAQYQTAFEKIKRYIEDGDCYQVNLAQRFVSDFKGDTWRHYLTLKQASPAPFSCYFHTPFGDILSFSPESFMSINPEGKIISQPIKGTRKRSSDNQLDEVTRQELLNSEKDKAENLMIVDLIRNDLSKSAEVNSVKVDDLFRIESFSNVHHMVSQVSAQKREDISHLHVLINAFPGGSITGAPKQRSMEIINELEPDAREVYCGAIGYLLNDKNMEFNISIRTLLVHEDKLYCWGGGGIVADSIADEEYQESINKISNLINIE